MRDIFVGCLEELAISNCDLQLITGDLGFGVFEEFQRKFPNQYLNVGVAEQNMTAIAAGMALEGHKVVTYSIANFPTFRCLEQIRNDVCYHDLDVKIVAVGGGFSYGALGMSHHATEDIAVLRPFANMTIVVPSSAYEVSQLTSQFLSLAGPGYLRLDKSMTRSEDAESACKLGYARTLRQGTDAVIIGCGGVLEEALRAADFFRGKGKSIRVISMHTIQPLDVSCLIDLAKEVKHWLVLQEHSIVGGLGSAIADFLCEQGIRLESYRKIGLRHGFSSVVGDQEYLRNFYEIDAERLIIEISDIFKEVDS